MKRNCYKNKQTSLLTQDGMPPLNQAVTLESAPETLDPLCNSTDFKEIWPNTQRLSGMKTTNSQ
jgi:hypothetical protein